MQIQVRHVVLLILVLGYAEASSRMRGGKEHRRSKRTIGEIINWKLGLIQSIFGGIFGGGKGKSPSSSYGAPSNSYGPPSNSYGPPNDSRGKGKNKGFQLPSLSLDGLFSKGPKNKGNAAPRPSYGAPRPSYGAPQAPQAPRAPQGPPRPNYSSGSTDFGPSNAIKMLPAPNLATARPTNGFGDAGYGGSSQSQDSYGSPQAPAVSSGDSYGAPQADPISQDSYGAPQADPISQDSYGAPQADPISQDSYGAPQAAPISSSSSGYRDAKVFSAPSTNFVTSNSVNQGSDSYGSPSGNIIAADDITRNTFQQASFSSASDSFGTAQSSFIAPSSSSDSYGAAQSPVIAPSGASDSYGAAQSPVVAPSSSSDSYGAAQGPVLSTSSALTSSSSEGANTYGTASSSIVSSGALDAVILENDAVRNVQTSNEIARIQSTLQQTTLVEDDPVDVYGSALAPVGTSAPVPEEIFTQDSKAQTSFDSYNPKSQTENIDLTSDNKIDNQKLKVAAVNTLVDLREDFNEDPFTPTSSPVLFTYGPLVKEEGNKLADPLNVLPDDYEYSNYEDTYDANDVPEDQAAPESLSSYGSNDLGSYGQTAKEARKQAPVEAPVEAPKQAPVEAPELISLTPPVKAPELIPLTPPVKAPELIPLTPPVDESANEALAQGISLPTTEYFDTTAADAGLLIDLRSVTFTTGAAPTPEPEITTYSPPIDFNLGTTASAGIEVEDVQYEDVELEEEETEITEPSNSVDAGLTEPTLRIAADEDSYEEDYNEEDESDYEPAGADIPIQVEKIQEREQVEDLPGYEPLVLLVGTPEQKSENLLLESELGEDSESSNNQKRKADPTFVDRYNNWFNRANDWSRKIQKVQGRIKFKNQS